MTSALKSIYDSEEFPKITKHDSYLENYKEGFKYRFQQLMKWLQVFEPEGGVEGLTNNRLGFKVLDDKITYTEYAPNPKIREAYLVGDFNGWQKTHPLQKQDHGKWYIGLEHQNGPCIDHMSKLKTLFVLEDGSELYRMSPYIEYAVQDLNEKVEYDSVFYNPPKKYQFKYTRPEKPTRPKIYEAHVGISSPDGRVGTYAEFTKNMLPRIKSLGYNVIQLMAIQEHAYYASFGYQVTSFYAASSRYGSPEDLKELIDTAHHMGIYVLLDIVHSHACSNIADGLNYFDGTDHCYFHGGPMGRHELWDSRLFNYGHYETMRFLLGNLKYWLDEFQFDGFRFDGVTSMLYKHHGIGTGFSGHYDEYFNLDSDTDAICYLTLANYLIHQYPYTITIAEDVSGMPGLCRPIEEGGIGFDYRLAMSLPDMWIKYLKHSSDDEWEMGHIVHQLINRRYMEKSICYCESHDQALVGDKTLAFWLMDKEMYEFMSDLSPFTPIIDRGIQLHKMIRLITFGLGGEGYLNFEGNEFGHPEWLDFPREGNGDSYHYCRRQWNVVDDGNLRYKYLNNFDRDMIHLDDAHPILDQWTWVSLKHESDKVVAFERGDLLFVFNFHHSQSYTDYQIGVDLAGTYEIVLNSDNKSKYLGHGRIDESVKYHTFNEEWCGRKCHVKMYLPTRTALVLARMK